MILMDRGAAELMALAVEADRESERDAAREAWGQIEKENVRLRQENARLTLTMQHDRQKQQVQNEAWVMVGPRHIKLDARNGARDRSCGGAPDRLRAAPSIRLCGPHRGSEGIPVGSQEDGC